MAKRIRALIRTSLIQFTSLAVILAACGTPAAAPLDPGNGDDDDDIDDGPDPIYQEVACPAFGLAVTSGMSMERIAIGALPAEFEAPFAAHLTIADDDSAGFAHIVANESGDHELLIPLHPTAPVNGGDVTLIVTDGTLACAPVEFSIDALPEADGEFASVVDLLQAILAEQAALLETTPEDLRTMPFENLAPAHWQLAIAQTILDGPDNEESLRAIADGALGSDVLDLIDRMLARTALRSSLEAPSANEHAAVLGASNEMSYEGCTAATIGGSASLLDQCMAKAAEIQRSTEGISKDVAEDIKYVISVGTKLKLPAVDVLERAFSILFWYIYNEREKAAGTLPSAFTSMTVEVDKPTFLEDEEGQGQVSTATVYATSTGWNAVEAIAEAMQEAFALAKEGAKFGEVFGAEQMTEALGKIVQQRMGDLPIGELDIPPELFGPVNVVDPEWSQARVAIGDAVALVGATTYEPRKAGTATLSIRTADGKFGGAQIAQQMDITVETIQLDFDPDVEFVTPGESKELTLTVQKSAFPDKVELIEGMERQGSVTMTYNGEAKYTVTYTAPQEPDPSKTDLIAVRHTATTGARGAPDAPERTATAELRFGRVTISPRAGCVDPDSTKQFTAAVQGFENQDVEWDASHGSIDDNGLYTAPSETPTDAQATIIATSVENPALVDAVTISIGCTCTFTLRVGGQEMVDTPGYRLRFTSYGEPGVTEEEDVVLSIGAYQIDGDQGGTMYPDPDGQSANEPGTYPVAASGGVPVQLPDFHWATDHDQATASIDIIDYVPERLLIAEAYGSVEVTYWEEDGETTDDYIAPFYMYVEIRVPEDWDPVIPTAFGYPYICDVGEGQN